VKAYISLGEAYISLGEAPISLGEASTSLGEPYISLGEAYISLGEAYIYLQVRRFERERRSGLEPWFWTSSLTLLSLMCWSFDVARVSVMSWSFDVFVHVDVLFVFASPGVALLAWPASPAPLRFALHRPLLSRHAAVRSRSMSWRGRKLLHRTRGRL
jgi:hypothetical protein